MKLSISSQEEESRYREPTITIEIADGSDIYETMTAIRGMLIAYGFENESIMDGCSALLEEYSKKI